jgi:hypothetical protein
MPAETTKLLYGPVPSPVSPRGPPPLAVPCAPFLSISRSPSRFLSAAGSSAPQLCAASSRAPALPFALLCTPSSGVVVAYGKFFEVQTVVRVETRLYTVRRLSYVT